jgi:hypothetical protein
MRTWSLVTFPNRSPGSHSSECHPFAFGCRYRGYSRDSVALVMPPGRQPIPAEAAGERGCVAELGPYIEIFAYCGEDFRGGLAGPNLAPGGRLRCIAVDIAAASADPSPLRHETILPRPATFRFLIRIRKVGPGPALKTLANSAQCTAAPTIEKRKVGP